MLARKGRMFRYILLSVTTLLYRFVPQESGAHLGVSIICGYFLFESTAWVMYYTVFRRFFEEKYSINHVLEYLVVLIILIPTQALAFANMYGVKFQDCLLGMMGIGDVDGHVLIHVLGLGFQIIVIAMIINSFPPEAVLVRNSTYKNIIIGCGDVVKNRLLPELLRRQEVVSYVYSTTPDPESKDYCKVTSEEKILKAIEKNSDEDSIIWIETPSSSHVRYLKALMEDEVSRKLIVMEKPMAVSREDLDFINSYLTESYIKK